MKHDVELRDVSEKDLPVFYKHQNDKDALEMAAFKPRLEKAFLEHWANKILGDETVTKKTILFKRLVAGHIVCWEQDGKPEIGYWIGKEYWGNGITTTALSMFLSQLKIRPLYAHVAKHNIASLRVLEKCGFKISGEDMIPSDPPGKEIEEFVLTLEG